MRRTRRTEQKCAIERAFRQADRPLSPEEVLSMAREQVGSVSLATVYRNIHSLTSEDWLTPVHLPGEAPRYEIAGKDHHHHFRCNSCHRVFVVPGCILERPPVLPAGFYATDHEFVVFGLCASCS